jgi:hypothetical protein
VCDQPFKALKTLMTGGTPVSATLGYFRNNMNLDMAVVDQQDNDVFMILGNGDGTFLTPWCYAVGTSPWSVISADFNNDKKREWHLSDFNELYRWYKSTIGDIS